jgi:hypothetical protein
MMTGYVNVANIVEANGKTVRENNKAIPHALPIGALVEITTDCPIGEFGTIYNGVRLFVVKHDRDCDGTPLYSLSFDRNVLKAIENARADIKNNRDSSIHPLLTNSLGRDEGSITDGWDEGSLLLIDAAPLSRRMATA